MSSLRAKSAIGPKMTMGRRNDAETKKKVNNLREFPPGSDIIADEPGLKYFLNFQITFSQNFASFILSVIYNDKILRHSGLLVRVNN